MSGLVFITAFVFMPVLGVASLFIYYREDKKKEYRNDIHKLIDESLKIR